MAKKQLGAILSFRITLEEEAELERLATADDRKPADLARLLFRKGLASQRRAARKS